MKATLDRDMEPYLIRGACNPQLDIGLLLPRNVVVPGRTEMRWGRPSIRRSWSAGPTAPELQPVTDDASTHLKAALSSVVSS